jgi:hypothetical protein
LLFSINSLLRYRLRCRRGDRLGRRFFGVVAIAPNSSLGVRSFLIPKAAAANCNCGYRYILEPHGSVSILDKANQDSYAPDEDGIIRATLDPTGLSGNQIRTISVWTDEAPNQPIILRLEVELPRIASVKPALVIWRRKESQYPQAVAVTAASASSFSIKSVVHDEGRFAIEIVTDTPENR